MENNFKTSFIPKKQVPGGQTKIRASHNLFSVIASILFIAVLAMAGGLLAWKLYLNKQIANLQAQTDAAEATFDPSQIAALGRLDARIETTKTLLNSHLAFSAFYDAMARITLKDVGFTSFAYNQNGSKVAVTMDGEAAGFGTLALQSDVLAKSENVLSSPVLSGVALQKNGHVLFTLSFNVNPSLISYRKNVVLTSTSGLQSATTTDSTGGTASTTATQASSTAAVASTTPKKK